MNSSESFEHKKISPIETSPDDIAMIVQILNRTDHEALEGELRTALENLQASYEKFNVSSDELLKAKRYYEKAIEEQAKKIADQLS